LQQQARGMQAATSLVRLLGLSNTQQQLQSFENDPDRARFRYKATPQADEGRSYCYLVAVGG